MGISERCYQKKMKNIYFAAVSLLLSFHLLAQQTNPSVIIGKVMDVEREPLAAATLSLFRYTDSTLLKVELTDDGGSFQFDEVAAGTYMIRVTSTGLVPYTSTPITLTPGITFNAGSITLAPDYIELDEAEVTTSRPIVTPHPDRTIVNVGQLLSAAGGTVLDVLKQSPGVSTSSEGGLSIRGKANITVLIDGRPTHLSGSELTDYLQGMPADQLHQVEVITRPSAKYDAQGTGGVINLKTKQGLTNGFNGNFSISGHQGRTFSSVNNIDINWKQNSFNVLFNYGYTLSNPVIELKYHNVMRDKDGRTESIEDKTFLSESSTATHNLRTGLDYTLGKTTIGATYNGNFKRYPDQQNRSRSDISFPQQALTAVNTSTRKREIRNPVQTFNAYLTQQLGKRGATFSVVADYLAYNRPLTYFLTNDFSVSGQPELGEHLRIRQRISSNIDIYGGKADLTYPISEKATVTAGVKTTLMKMDNDAAFEIYSAQSDDYVKDSERSSHYLFDENIHAAYVDFDQRLDDTWQLQVGLRLENNRSDGENIDRKERFNRRHTKLFPSVSLTLQANENHSFTASFAQRINRPEYSQLIPYSFYTDLLYYQQGNPRIAPEVDKSIQLSHTFAGKLTTSAAYSRLNDVIIWTYSREDGSQALVYGFGNIDRMDTYSMTIDYTDQLASWYVVIVNATTGYDSYQGMLSEDYTDNGAGFAYAQLLNQLRFNGGWAAEVTGMFMSSYQDGPLAIGDPYGQVNVTVVKRVFGDKGSIRFLAADIFGTDQYKTYSRQKALDSKSYQNGFTRRFGLSFTYRFGTGQRPQTKAPSSSTENEAGRL